MENHYPLQFLQERKGVVCLTPMSDNTAAVLLVMQGVNNDDPDYPTLSDCYIVGFEVLDADKDTIDKWVDDLKEQNRIPTEVKIDRYISFERHILTQRHSMSEWVERYGDDVMDGFSNAMTALFLKTQETITTRGGGIVVLDEAYADELEANMNAVSFSTNMEGSETITDEGDITPHISCAMLAFFALKQGMLAKLGTPIW